jgi:hypothetical protein
MGMLARVALAFGCLLCGTAVPMGARGAARASQPALGWNAPSACPSADLMERVMRLTGLPRERLGAKLLRVDAIVRLTASGGWEAQLAIVTAAGSGERRFSAEDCASLIDGAALILALAVDPTVVAARATPPSLAGSAVSHPKSVRRPSWLLRPLLAADMGVLPDVGLAYGLAVGLAWPRVRVEADGSFMSAQEVADGVGRGGRIRLLLGSHARACLVPWRYRRIESAVCLGPALAWLRSTGNDNITFAETHDTLSVSLLAGVAVGLRLVDWLWLRAEGSLGVVVRRPRFQVTDESQSRSDVYSVRRLTGRVGGGLEFRL